MAALGPFPHDGAVDVLGVGGPDVARASTAVGDFWGAGHDGKGGDVCVLDGDLYLAIASSTACGQRRAPKVCN